MILRLSSDVKGEFSPPGRPPTETLLSMSLAKQSSELQGWMVLTGIFSRRAETPGGFLQDGHCHPAAPVLGALRELGAVWVSSVPNLTEATFSSIF